MNIVIINGTLCQPSLWIECTQCITQHMNDVYITYQDISTGHSIQEYAQRIASSINNLEGNTWVLGYSLGGVIGLELAINNEVSIDGLILVCTNHRGQTPQKQEAMKKQLDTLNNSGLEQLFDDILLPAYFGDDLAMHSKESERVTHMGLSLGEDVLKRQLNTLSTRVDQSEYLSRITVPTLLLCAEKDILCTLQDNRIMAECIPHAKLVEFEKRGHMLPLLEPRRLAYEIIQFITTHV